MSDFASELKAARGTIAPPTKAEEAPAAAQASPEVTESTEGLAAHMSEGHGMEGLSVGSIAVDQTVADKAERQPDVADEIPKIKIAGKEFSSLEAAIKYAEELELAKREQDAYVEGVKAAQTKPAAEPIPVEKTYLEKAEAVLFENPTEALKILEAGIEKRIFDAYDKMTTEQRKASIQAAQKEQVWNDFYSENGDLAESKEYVDFMLSRNPDLLKKQVPEALKELADISRKGLRITKQAALPRTELPSKPAITASASMGATGGQAQVTAEPEMDFVTALRNMRKRK